MFRSFIGACLALALGVTSAIAADGPELIFKKSTVWKFLTPDHKLATYAIDDPLIDGVSCSGKRRDFRHVWCCRRGF